MIYYILCLRITIILHLDWNWQIRTVSVEWNDCKWIHLYDINSIKIAYRICQKLGSFNDGNLPWRTKQQEDSYLFGYQ